MTRTDSHVVVVANHSSGARFQAVGSQKECEVAAAAQQRAWKGDKLEVLIQKR